ncbi:unnamed protein product [Sphenostylis stenocarpa]|uniref:Uncharacterized protein n=1 Tax=Sphenostylis stenocarpa TaxID=92480 RepID=A0AA86SRW8_9FABA|nr:unnamed protein product [Sphenostylis stenocarpa]
MYPREEVKDAITLKWEGRSKREEESEVREKSLGVQFLFSWAFVARYGRVWKIKKKKVPRGKSPLVIQGNYALRTIKRVASFSVRCAAAFFCKVQTETWFL